MNRSPGDLPGRHRVGVLLAQFRYGSPGGVVSRSSGTRCRGLACRAARRRTARRHACRRWLLARRNAPAVRSAREVVLRLIEELTPRRGRADHPRSVAADLARPLRPGPAKARRPRPHRRISAIVEAAAVRDVLHWSTVERPASSRSGRRTTRWAARLRRRFRRSVRPRQGSAS